MNKRTIVIIALVVLVLIVAGVYFLWYARRGQVPPAAAPTAATPSGLGSQLYGQTAAPVTSPLQSANPFENVKTNPFE